jgi:hypothetical protein
VRLVHLHRDDLLHLALLRVVAPGGGCCSCCRLGCCSFRRAS